MVKPQYKDHAQVTTDVIFTSRWSLCTGCFCTGFNEKYFPREQQQKQKQTREVATKADAVLPCFVHNKISFQIGEK